MALGHHLDIEQACVACRRTNRIVEVEFIGGAGAGELTQAPHGYLDVARTELHAVIEILEVALVPDFCGLAVAAGILPNEKIAENAIPLCNIVYVAGAEMRSQLSPLFEILFAANPASVGGQVPDEGFYYLGK